MEWIFSGSARAGAVLIFLMVIGCRLMAQEESKQSILEQRIETIAGNLEEGEELDYTSLLEDLTWFLEHPINLNNTNADELNELQLLTDAQVVNLLVHLERYGPLRSVFELQVLKGYDLTTIRLIEPFVEAVPVGEITGFSLRALGKEGRSDLILRHKRILEKQPGYFPDPETGLPSLYAGTPDYALLRYRFTWRKSLAAGISLESDAGESLNHGPDFGSGFLYYHDRTFIRKLVVGDFNAQFGQGLALWNGLGFGKSAFVLNLKRNAWGLRPYSSLDENMYFRGAGTTLGWGKTELTVFYSSKKVDAGLDANIDSTLYGEEEYVASLVSGGYHRTENELANRKTLGQQVSGGNIRFASRRITAGITAVHTVFSSPIEEQSSWYQKDRFSGKENTTIGLDYQAVAGNTNFFGEIARSANGGIAIVNGMTSAVDSRLSVSLLHRYYEPNFQSQFVNAFGESSGASNEQGVYVGTQVFFNRKWTATAYADMIRYPWLKFRVDAPSVAYDQLVQLNYKPDKKHEFYVRFRQRNGVLNTAAEDEEIIDYPAPEVKRSFRIHASYTVHPNLKLQTRAEWSFYHRNDQPETDGFMLYQDLVWKKLGLPVSFAFRYALFSSPSWDNRIYAYENDVLYSYSIPAYSGTGIRWYGMVKFDVSRGVDLWVRFSQWNYTDRATISSGGQEISGRTKTELHTQLRWQF